MHELNERSIKNLKGIHSLLVQVMQAAITNSPINYVITDGVRTTEEQQEIYAQGRTKPGKIVTNVDGIKSKSKHQPKEDGYGYAVDLYALIDNKVQLNDTESLKIIAEHIKATAKELNINIEWGGDWKNFKDFPHFELKNL